MGEIRPIPKVRPLAGLLATNKDLLQQAQDALVDLFGPVISASAAICFKHTQYYAQEMGTDLLRRFLVFASLRSADELPDWKLETNRLEQKLGLNEKGGRCVNIDPGYFAPGKLVLASTKDHAHRLYLQKGIYAEVTLRICDKHLRAWEWTYPDYVAAIDFFEPAYQAYLQTLRING